MNLAAIEQLGFVRWIATGAGVYPAFSAAHVLGIALLVGPILLADLRLAGLRALARLDDALHLLIRAAMVGFALAAATGLPLASVQAQKYAGNPAFQLKMGLIVLAGANALLLRSLLRGEDWRNAAGLPAARICGLASALLWIAIILAGRWIAFVE
jgi:hypothetical protein